MEVYNSMDGHESFLRTYYSVHVFRMYSGRMDVARAGVCFQYDLRTIIDVWALGHQ